MGLGIDHVTGEFRQVLAYQAGARERRNQAMVEKMKAAGITVEYEDIRAFAGGRAGMSGGGPQPAEAALTAAPEAATFPVTAPKAANAGATKMPVAGELLVGRPHFGAFLISRRIVKNQEQAFKRWLGKGRPFYVPKEGLPFEQAARLIHQSGGAAVLAHPLSLYVSWGRLPIMLEALKDRGLDGLEAWHPTAAVKACKRLEELGRRFGLCITAGSDFHGSARPERKLGYTAGNRKIENEFLEGIPNGARRLRGLISPG